MHSRNSVRYYLIVAAVLIFLRHAEQIQKVFQLSPRRIRKRNAPFFFITADARAVMYGLPQQLLDVFQPLGFGGTAESRLFRFFGGRGILFQRIGKPPRTLPMIRGGFRIAHG